LQKIHFKTARPCKPGDEIFHELGRADLLVGLDAPLRVPTGFMALMRDLGIEEATQGSNDAIPVRTV